MIDCIAELFQPKRERVCEMSDTLGNLPQSIGTMIDGIHACHDGKQHLRCANVRRCFLSPNMLLARLQRHAKRPFAAGIDRDADEASGNEPFEFVFDRHVRGVRTAVTERNAEALRVSDRGVRTEFAGRREQRKCENIRRYCDVRACRMSAFTE